MSDFDRALWRTTLGAHSGNSIGADSEAGRWCQDYWSEALSEANAHKRNEHWKTECHQFLHYRAEQTNENYGELISQEETPRNAINQYVRIMN